MPPAGARDRNDKEPLVGAMVKVARESDGPDGGLGKEVSARLEIMRWFPCILPGGRGGLISFYLSRPGWMIAKAVNGMTGNLIKRNHQHSTGAQHSIAQHSTARSTGCRE